MIDQKLFNYEYALRIMSCKIRFSCLIAFYIEQDACAKGLSSCINSSFGGVWFSQRGPLNISPEGFISYLR